MIPQFTPTNAFSPRWQIAAILSGPGRGVPGTASAQLDAISRAADELKPEPTGTVEFITPRKPRTGSPASVMAQAVAAT